MLNANKQTKADISSAKQVYVIIIIIIIIIITIIRHRLICCKLYIVHSAHCR